MFVALYIRELWLISWLQSFRSPLVDSFFKAVNIFDQDFTYLIIIILVSIFFNARAGFRLFYLQTVTLILCGALKAFFAQPRPYNLLPALKIVGTVGYGLPSGAASSATVCFGFIFFLMQKTNLPAKLCALVMIFLIGITRVYLGAHFPSDVVGGYLLGLMVLLGYYYLVDYFATKLALLSRKKQLFFHSLFLFFLFLLHPGKRYFLLLSLLWGSISWHLFFAPSSSCKRGSFISCVISALICIAGVIILGMIYFRLIPLLGAPTLIFLTRVMITIIAGFFLGAATSLPTQADRILIGNRR